MLLVDNDPQASLTQGFLGPPMTRHLDPAETIAAVYQQEAIPDQVLRATEIPNVDLLAGTGSPRASTSPTRTWPTGRSRWPCATSWPTSAADTIP